MKKFISVIAAGAISLCALLGGCSCTGDQTLSFDIDASKTETLTYSVSFAENYLGNFTKSAALGDAFTYEYDAANGELKTTLSRRNDLTGITSDIIDDARVNKTVYEFTTTFTVPLKVTVGDTEYNHIESVKTTALFTKADVSLAPIYAKEESEYLNISVSNAKTTVKILKSETVTRYTTENLTVATKYKYFDGTAPASEITLDNETATERTASYTFRTVIDNAELLFALRAFALDESASATVQVVSPSYKEPSSIKITNDRIATSSFNINGASQNVEYNTLSFYLNSTNASGVPQYAKVQKSATSGTNPLLLEYAKPLVCSYEGSYNSMGWLIFTLSTAE